MAKFPVNLYEKYHAHVYFEQATYLQAQQLHQLIGEKFTVTVGRIHAKAIGPHTQWSFQVSFTHIDFDEFIPWLDTYRQQLSVLVHALSDNALKDHTDDAYWLGGEIPLNLSLFE